MGATTADQRAERQWMADLVEQTGVRYRLLDDAEGWPVIPGRLGRVEWGGDRIHLTVFTDRSRAMIRKLRAMPAVCKPWQIGDDEARVSFPANATALRSVCALIRARVRRAATAGNPEALVEARRRKATETP